MEFQVYSDYFSRQWNNRYIKCSTRPTYRISRFSYGEGVENNEWIQAIKVIEPACRSHVKGKVNISFQAKGENRESYVLEPTYRR